MLEAQSGNLPARRVGTVFDGKCTGTGRAGVLSPSVELSMALPESPWPSQSPTPSATSALRAASQEARIAPENLFRICLDRQNGALVY